MQVHGRDFGGDEYVASFLMGRSTDGAFTPNHTRGALKFVELITDKTALVARYYGQPTPRASQDVFDMKLKKSENQIPRAQYAINWRDLSTKEDRDYWIAGSVLEVIDLENKKLIAERIGYMFDSGLGTRNGGRSPWAYAEYNACPAFQKSAGGYPIKSSRSRDFILRVLKPIQGE